jgi:hypothetical protein
LKSLQVGLNLRLGYVERLTTEYFLLKYLAVSFYSHFIDVKFT